MKTLSVVIPVYNEKKTLLDVLRLVEASSAAGLNKEIILVDDFSTDGTRDILKELAATGKYKILFQEKNGGKGSALRAGFAKATGDFILVQDADLECDPNEYPDLLAPLLAGTADVVYGSRFAGYTPRMLFRDWHYFGNWLLTTLSNICTRLDITDMETCYKVFTKDVLTKILPDLRSNRFGFEPEVTAIVAANKFRVHEVGISYSGGRTYEEGKKINWKDGVSAIWTILTSWFRFSSFGRDRFKTYTLLSLLFLTVFSIAVLHPEIKGDGFSYLEMTEILKTGILPDPFFPLRIITGFFGVVFLTLVDSIIQNIHISWLLINSIFYIVMGMVFYALLRKLSRSPEVSFLSTLFLVTNYAAVTAGLGYLMDVSGWMFYVISLYGALRYMQTKNGKWLYLSAVAIGLGGEFKEYALLGYIVLSGCILFVHWRQWIEIVKKLFVSGLIASGPFIAMNIYSLIMYDFTYVEWLSAQGRYVYEHRILEYIKSFGSLYNFGWLLFFPGLYLLLKDSRKLFQNESVVFMWLALLSFLPVFIWDAITQRILFIATPALIMVSSLFIERMQRHRYLILSLLGLYILSSYLMDAFILDFVNLPF